MMGSRFLSDQARDSRKCSKRVPVPLRVLLRQMGLFSLAFVLQEIVRLMTEFRVRLLRQALPVLVSVIAHPVFAGDDLSQWSATTDSRPSKMQQEWALATIAIPSGARGLGIESLSVNPQYAMRSLWQQHRINDRDTFFRHIAWLEQTGYRGGFEQRAARLALFRSPQEQERQAADVYDRFVLKWGDFVAGKSLRAIDYIEYISVCRKAESAGYISEREGWRLIMPAARLLQNTFASWQALGRNYMLALDFEYAANNQSARFSSWAWTYFTLLQSKDSPWRVLPWNTDLGTGARQRIAGKEETSAYLYLVPHPGGLNCFSLTLFGRTDADGLETAISEVLGCRVHSVRTSQLDGNTEISGECNASRGARNPFQINALFPLAPMVAPLQERHVVQLFTNVSHPIAGVSHANLTYRWENHGDVSHFGLRDVNSGIEPIIASIGFPSVKGWRLAAALIAAFALAMLCAGMEKWRTSTQSGIAVFRAWIGVRIGFWLFWILGLVLSDGLSIVRFWQGNDGAYSGIIAAFILWGFGLATDLAVTSLFRSSFQRVLQWETAPSHLLGRVLREDFCVFPAFLLVLFTGDPQREPNLPASMLLLIALALLQIYTLLLASTVPQSWRVAEESGAFSSHSSALTQRVGRAIDAVIVRRGEPMLMGIVAASPQRVLIPEAFLDQMSDVSLAALIQRSFIEAKQRKAHTRTAMLLTIPIGMLLLFEMTFASASIGALMLLAQLLCIASLFLRTRRSLVLRSDLEAAFTLRGARGLIAAILEEARMRNCRGAGGECERIWFQPSADYRARRLDAAYALDPNNSLSPGPGTFYLAN